MKAARSGEICGQCAVKERGIAAAPSEARIRRAPSTGIEPATHGLEVRWAIGRPRVAGSAQDAGCGGFP